MMRTRLLTLLLALGAVRAEAAPAAPARMPILETHMAGQRVLAAGYGRWNAEVSAKDLARADSMAGRLQIIGEAASRHEKGLIPFVVGRSWVLASEMREEFRIDPGDGALYEALPGRTLLEMAMTALSQEQVKRLGTEGGIPLSELPPEARSAIMAAFRPPMEVTGWESVTAPDGSQKVRPVTVASLSDRLDPARVRIRANLRMNGIGFEAGKGMTGSIGTGHQSRFGRPWLVSYDGRTGEPDDGFSGEPSFLREVPNRYKPSDLDGRGFQKPIGIRGTFRLPDVLAQMGRVTGLRLHAASGYRHMPVFLGSAQITCGEVMDGLRLALGCSWRRLGDVYILAWDRRGFGALQQMAEESRMALRDRVEPLQLKADTSPGWLTIAYNLPFAPDDPLALTDKQRRLLFDPVWDLGDGEEKQPRIRYEAMTVEQQAHLRSLIGTGTMHTSSLPPDRREGESEDPPVTEEAVSKSYLRSVFDVRLSLDLPGIGWVDGPDWLMGALHPRRLTQARRIVGDQPAPTPFLKLLREATPSALPAETRALMVPVLPPERLTALAEEMARHGLNTLLYPALSDGYATFPTTTFPPHPSLAGQDGLAAAVRAMRPARIRVVATVSTLTWRNAGDKVHWLDAHPGWIDHDVLGRTRREVVRAYPRLKRRDSLALHAPGDAVRPQEPAVAGKLKALVSELARREDVDAIAFTDVFTDVPATYDRSLSLPPLGYAVPDRLAAVKAGRDDPVDVETRMAYGLNLSPQDPSAVIRPGGAEADGAAPTERRPCADLLAALVERVQSTRKDAKTWLVDAHWQQRYGQSSVTDLARPRPDVTVPSGPYERNRARLLTIDPRDAYWSEDTPAAERAYPAMAWAMLNLGGPEGQTGAPARNQSIVLDFRTCPEDISEALKWLRPE